MPGQPKGAVFITAVLASNHADGDQHRPKPVWVARITSRDETFPTDDRCIIAPAELAGTAQGGERRRLLGAGADEEGIASSADGGGGPHWTPSKRPLAALAAVSTARNG